MADCPISFFPGSPEDKAVKMRLQNAQKHRNMYYNRYDRPLSFFPGSPEDKVAKIRLQNAQKQRKKVTSVNHIVLYVRM